MATRRGTQWRRLTGGKTGDEGDLLQPYQIRPASLNRLGQSGSTIVKVRCQNRLKNILNNEGYPLRRLRHENSKHIGSDVKVLRHDAYLGPVQRLVAAISSGWAAEDDQ